MKKEILGVRIDDIPETEILGMVERWVGRRGEKNARRGISGEPRTIFTVGPEFLVTASQDEEFRGILNQSDLNLPEGFGLQLYGGVKNRIPGILFVENLCRLAATTGWSIGLLGGEKGVTKETASKLIETYPNIKIGFTIDGEEANAFLEWAGSCQLATLRRTSLNDLPLVGRGTRRARDLRLGDPSRCHLASNFVGGVDVLFVAFGHPKQEKLLFQLQEKLLFQFKRQKAKGKSMGVSFKVGVGVGGTFNYISGRRQPAPGWIQGLGLEWLWRLVTQINRPNHIKRILNATIVFPFLLLRERLAGE